MTSALIARLLRLLMRRPVPSRHQELETATRERRESAVIRRGRPETR